MLNHNDTVVMAVMMMVVVGVACGGCRRCDGSRLLLSLGRDAKAEC